MHFLQLDFKAACEYLGGKSDADPAEVERQRKEYERIRAEQEAAEAAALLARRKKFAERAVWKRYHANLDAVQGARQLWRDAGVPDAWQDFLRLGYTPDLWARPDEPGLGPALTIPYRTLNKTVVTMQYRLQHVNGMGKYIFQPGLGTEAFILRHDLPFAQILITEGAKKSIVAHIRGTEGQLQTLGTPSENHIGSQEIEQVITQAKEIWWWPDPGDKAYEWALDHIQRLGIQNKTKLVRFTTAKVDDALLSGLSMQGFKASLSTARLASLIINRRNHEQENRRTRRAARGTA